jgi:HTH-type transcriptional regulator / antitoxin HipB
VLSQPNLGDLLKQHRKQSGLSQQQLAEMVGVGKTVVFDLENGKSTVKLSTLLKILKGLNISVKLESPLLKSDT